MNIRKITTITLIVACLVLAGCASTGVASPIATQPPEPMIVETAVTAPTETLAPTATSTVTSAPHSTSALPTETEFPTPENTPIPTATDYPTPAVPLSPAGPWLVFRDEGDMNTIWDGGCLWAINQDGTGLTRLANEPAYAFAVKPGSSVQHGLTVTYVPWFDRGAIRILSWPGGDVKTIVYKNLSDRFEHGESSMYAYQDRGIVWSPSGSKLAFVSAMDDTSLNVFVYDTVTEQITRIAVTDDNDFRLLWSADERYVIFQSFIHSIMVGTVFTGVWSARADGSGVTQLVGTIENQHIGGLEYLGWLSSTEIVVTFKQWIFGENVINTDIRILNIETGDYTTLISEPLLDVAYSPEHNLWLMTKEVAPSPNRLLIFYQNGERREVTGYTIKTVEWLSTYNVFLGQTPSGLSYLITPEGAVTAIPSPEWKIESEHRVIASPDGQWWVWHKSGYHYWDTSAAELWAGPAMAQPSMSLSFGAYRASGDFRVYWDRVIWSPDSQYLLWITRRGLFVAQAPNFEAVLATQLSGDATFLGAIWVQ